MKNDNKCHLS